MLPYLVNKYLKELINKNTPGIAPQFVPDNLEKVIYPEELADPIGDSDYSPLKGLVHRYSNRVLLLPTMECAAYCRFCFRRSRVGAKDSLLSEQEITNCLTYIKNNPQINEIILSGGDPLVCHPDYLKNMVLSINELSNINLLRFHTRVPVVNPDLITEEILEAIKASNKSLWMVLHINCAAELTKQVKQTIKKLREAGISLLSQSVLLKNVNDSCEQLTSLCSELLQQGIKPYYLHYPDLAPGISHFRIPLAQAISLYEEVKSQISGIALPAFIIDLPAGKGKINLNFNTCTQIDSNTWEFLVPASKEKIHIIYPPQTIE